MMKEQSVDFIEGYVFNTLDRKIFKHDQQQGVEQLFTVEAQVPLLWMGIRNYIPLSSIGKAKLQAVFNIMVDVAKSLDSKLHDIFLKKEFSTTVAQDRQYIKFFTQVRTDVVKKMTVSEIESALGYKVEIVADEIKHFWEHHKCTPGGIHDTYICSHCGYETGWTTPRCPSCGEQMQVTGGNIK